MPAFAAALFTREQLLKRSPQPHDPAHCIDSRRGLMSFFSSGCNGSKGEPSIRWVRLQAARGNEAGDAQAFRCAHSRGRLPPFVVVARTKQNTTKTNMGAIKPAARRSDNGLCDAQKFFVRLRPLEGRMKGAAPSRTTHSGARFDSPLAKAAARR